MKRKKSRLNWNNWFKKYWVLEEKWTKAFFISHIVGWGVAWIQTVWILAEIKRKKY